MNSRQRPLVVSLGTLLSAALVGACSKPLDEGQCDKLVDRMVDLLAASETPADRAEKVKGELKSDRRSLRTVKDTCVGKMTKRQYECVMAAKTFDDATACDEK